MVEISFFFALFCCSECENLRAVVMLLGAGCRRGNFSPLSCSSSAGLGRVTTPGVITSKLPSLVFADPTETAIPLSS